MSTEIREMMDKLKGLKRSKEKQKLNEGVFSCNIEDLHKSVLDYVNNKLHYPKDSIVVEKNNEYDNNAYVLISYDYRITNNYSWNNLNDDSIMKKLATDKSNFENMFSHFKNFCDSGVRGFVGTFKKGISMVNINSTITLDKVIFVQPDVKNSRQYNKHVYRFTETNKSDLGDYDTFIKRYGDKDIDIVKVRVGLFLKEI